MLYMDTQKKELLTNIFTLFPQIGKKIMRHLKFSEMPKQQFKLLHIISCHDNRPMSFYSEMLMVSKPNLTVLVDKLIEAGYVERHATQGDRRRIVLKITESGRAHVKKILNESLKDIMKSFEKMDYETLVRLNELVVEMSEIINKFDGLSKE